MFIYDNFGRPLLVSPPRYSQAELAAMTRYALGEQAEPIEAPAVAGPIAAPAARTRDNTFRARKRGLAVLR